tara:strand:+ start:4162 stop:4797 length:636 start_codon:yes stop_codon:yes gene_type:complete
MKVLVFDTETNGLPKNNFESIFNTDNFPFIMQISYILYDSENLSIIKVGDEYINNVEIKQESFNINKITKEMVDNGKHIKIVLDDFIKVIKECDILVGHNYAFDKKIIMVECLRNKLFYKLNYIIKQKQYYCTMRNSKHICKIPSIYKIGDYKLPKLIELHESLFNEKIVSDKLHNSLTDCIFTLKCYIMMNNNINIFKHSNECTLLLEKI